MYSRGYLRGVNYDRDLVRRIKNITRRTFNCVVGDVIVAGVY